MNKLAINGGDKAIKHDHPHWRWPHVSNEEIDALNDYMRNMKYNNKGYPTVVELLEKEFSEYNNIKYTLTTNSGTSALQAAYFAIGIKGGDEVIVPTLTFYATATPLFQLGATPVLIDCDPGTYNIDPKQIEKRITNKTKAIAVTHLWGHPCEMDEILQIASTYNLKVIEDCSHAHGALYKGKKVGTFGDISCFSLDNKKIMACGEAGLLCTNSKTLFERALIFGDFGPRPEFEVKNHALLKFASTGLGNKFRMNPMAAAVARIRLKNLDYYIEERSKRLNYLSKAMEEIPGISGPVTKEYCTRGAFFGYKPSYNKDELNDLQLDEFIVILQSEGMDIRKTVSPPLHQLHLFKTKLNKILPNTAKDSWSYELIKSKDEFKNSERIMDTTFSLPTFTFETFDLIDSYIIAFKKVCFYHS
jgi:perosamine synthetase